MIVCWCLCHSYSDLLWCNLVRRKRLSLKIHLSIVHKSAELQCWSYLDEWWENRIWCTEMTEKIEHTVWIAAKISSMKECSDSEINVSCLIKCASDDYTHFELEIIQYSLIFMSGSSVLQCDILCIQSQSHCRFYVKSLEYHCFLTSVCVDSSHSHAFLRARSLLQVILKKWEH